MEFWVCGLILAAYLYAPSGTGRTLLILTGVVVAVLGFWGGATEPHYGNNGRQMQN